MFKSIMDKDSMRIVIASGKGGTGKTTVSVSLAWTLGHHGNAVTLLDCDVEEPNDHLFVQPHFTDKKEVTLLKPVWDPDICTACGKCVEACRYNALALVKKTVLVFNELCHSCGVCSYVCPENAFREVETPTGEIHIAEDHSPFTFAHGILNIGEARAPAVVAEVKKYAAEDGITIIDSAPGTACPVVEAVTDADVAVLVTEPTPFGLNDLRLAAQLTLKIGVPTGIVVNRSDGTDALIQEFADESGIPIIGRIPFDRRYAETYAEGDILAEKHSEIRDAMVQLYEQCSELSKHPSQPLFSDIPVDVTPEPEMEKVKGVPGREIVIISGKGGTGKTTVTSCFAQLAGDSVIADNDVDAADMHLLLAPEMQRAHPFYGGAKARINAEKCIGCGKCAEACRFNAISFDGPANDVVQKTYHISDMGCEGCGLCPRVCPTNAIEFSDVVTGNWFVSETSYGEMAHAKLGVAEENSGKLVTRVRNTAAECAVKKKKDIIADGPPGTGCPVIASVSGVDAAVIVTEPTVSGVHDLTRVLQLAQHFGVPAMVIINKADLSVTQAGNVRKTAAAYNARVIAEIPFDPHVNTALMEGQTLIAYGKGPACNAVRSAWNTLQEELNNG